jgi:non-ribosomal peptide synthetase component E (peptide arylation enzyme)
LPKHIEFIDALPRSGVGKIDKRALKARAEGTAS